MHQVNITPISFKKVHIPAQKGVVRLRINLSKNNSGNAIFVWGYLGVREEARVAKAG
jgi:hypothetical protein